jgi:exonuclease SbcD
MKILFSSDWHLGYELGGANRVDRLPDQARQLRQIAALIEEHDVDVLAIAGDVFEAQERARARSAVGVLMESLRGPIERGLQIVAIAGNHDRDYFMETANLWLDGLSPGSHSSIVLRTRPGLYDLTVRDETVTFVLMPFPTPTRYEAEIDRTRGAGLRNEEMTRAFVQEMERLRQEAAALRQPAVLLTHVTVEGTEVGPHRIAPRDDVVVPRSGFPEFELTVVGHIHKPERLGSSHFYYVGALDRMDIGEIAYQPRVLIAEIGARGVVAVTSHDLDATPFADVVAESEDDLQRQHAAMARPEDTLVRLKLRAKYGTYTAPLLDAARRLFPRIYGNPEYEWLDRPEVQPSIVGLERHDVIGTIQRYIDEQVEDADERAGLKALVNELREAAQTQ